MKAGIKCELNGKAFKPGDDIPADMEEAFRARGWQAIEKAKAKAEKNDAGRPAQD